MRGRRQGAAGDQRIVPPLAKVFEQARPVELTIPAIDLGDFLLQFLEITLRKTAHDIQSLQVPLCLTLTLFKDDIDALLLGIADETAGIDHTYITFRHLRIVSDDITSLAQLRHQALAIHEVLGATQTKDINRLSPRPPC